MNKLDCAFSRAEMATALARLSGVPLSRSTLPVASCVRVSASDDGTALRLEATDFDRYAATSVRLAEPVDPFPPVCVPLATLRDFAKAYPGVSAKLRTASEDTLVFSSGGSRASLMTLPGDEFPEPPPDDAFAQAGAGPCASLKTALAAVSYAICTETHRPALLGVNMGQNGAGYVAVATNGHVLSKETLAGWESDMEPATVPTAAVHALLRFLPDEGDVQVLRSETRLRFVSDAGTFTTGTLDHPYPNYGLVIPKDNPISVSVNRVDLLSAVRRVTLVLENSKRITLDVSADSIAIHAQGVSGSADETIPADVRGGTLRIAMAADYVAETLSSLTGDNVNVGMNAAHTATLWRSPDGAGVRLLMPLRIDP